MLSKEQKKAFETIEKHFAEFNDHKDNAALLESNGPLLKTDFIASSSSPFDKTKIPRQKHWTWNQSNTKTTAKLGEDTTVTFRKISPRKKYLDLTAPKLKIWLYHITSETKEDSYFLWCEKGSNEQSAGINTEIGVIFPQDVTTESLAFLSQFTDSVTAHELGWT